jgi:hypothetical protein
LYGPPRFFPLRETTLYPAFTFLIMSSLVHFPRTRLTRHEGFYPRTVRTGRGACAATSQAAARSTPIATAVAVSNPQIPNAIKSAPSDRRRK